MTSRRSQVRLSHTRPIWVGFFALFKGIMQIVLAFGIRHAGKEAEAASAMS